MEDLCLETQPGPATQAAGAAPAQRRPTCSSSGSASVAEPLQGRAALYAAAPATARPRQRRCVPLRRPAPRMEHTVVRCSSLALLLHALSAASSACASSACASASSSHSHAQRPPQPSCRRSRSSTTSVTPGGLLRSRREWASQVAGAGWLPMAPLEAGSTSPAACRRSHVAARSGAAGGAAAARQAIPGPRAGPAAARWGTAGGRRGPQRPPGAAVGWAAQGMGAWRAGPADRAQLRRREAGAGPWEPGNLSGGAGSARRRSAEPGCWAACVGDQELGRADAGPCHSLHTSAWARPVRTGN